MSRMFARVMLISAMLVSVPVAKAEAPSTQSAGDSRLAWFHDAKFGMFIHWGIYSVPAGEYGGAKNYAEWIQLQAKIPGPEYEKYAAQFDPEKFDAKEWVRVAKDAGMKYIVITSKHHDGFCMFDTKLTDYSITKATPFKRDPIAELSTACRDAGITFCVYYSVPDWHYPDFPAKYSQHQFHGAPNPNADLEKYVTYVKGQIRELLTNYGPIGIVWFDGGGSFAQERAQMPGLIHAQEIIDEIHQLQPNCLVNNRLGLPGDYTTPEQKIPANGLGDTVWETCMTLNGHWGYNKDDHKWKEPKVVIQNLADIASKGGNYLLNVGPTSEGVFPPDAIRILGEVGKWMSVNGESIYGTHAGPLDATPSWGRVTQKDGRIYLHVFEVPADGQLSVSGKLPKVKQAYLLADSDKKALKQESDGNTLKITLPDAPRDAIDTVVVLESE